MIKGCIWPQHKASGLWESTGCLCTERKHTPPWLALLSHCRLLRSPSLGSKGCQGHPPSPQTPPPALSRLILLSILLDNKDTEGIYLYLQPANETIPWKAAPACWSLLRALIASSVVQFPAFTRHINFPRWIDTILPGNPFVPLAVLFKSLVLLFIIIVKL